MPKPAISFRCTVRFFMDFVPLWTSSQRQEPRRPPALGSGRAGGTYRAPSASDLVHTDPALITGPRATGGGLPQDPEFLVPADGSALGARFPVP